MGVVVKRYIGFLIILLTHLYLLFLQLHLYFIVHVLNVFSYFKNKKEECQIAIFYFAWCVRKCCYYGDVIHLFDWKSAVEHDGGI